MHRLRQNVADAAPHDVAGESACIGADRAVGRTQVSRDRVAEGVPRRERFVLAGAIVVEEDRPCECLQATSASRRNQRL
jgi:hypothetical protein